MEINKVMTLANNKEYRRAMKEIREYRVSFSFLFMTVLTIFNFLFSFYLALKMPVGQQGITGLIIFIFLVLFTHLLLPLKSEAYKKFSVVKRASEHIENKCELDSDANVYKDTKIAKKYIEVYNYINILENDRNIIVEEYFEDKKILLEALKFSLEKYLINNHITINELIYMVHLQEIFSTPINTKEEIYRKALIEYALTYNQNVPIRQRLDILEKVKQEHSED